MKYFDEEGEEMSEEYYTYLTEMLYCDSLQKESDIFTNGRLDIYRYINEIKKIKLQAFKNDEEFLKNFILKDSIQFLTYKEKIDFWKENNLCPLKEIHSFNTEKKGIASFSIIPIKERDERLFFEYLVNWFNKILSSNKNAYSVDFHSFEELIYSIDNKEISFEILKLKIEQNKKRIENYFSREQWFIKDYAEFYKNSDGGNIMDMFTIKNPNLNELIIIAYLVSPINGYLQFEKFLTDELKISKKDIFLKNEKKNESILPYSNTTFKTYLSEDELKNLFEFLIEKSYIEKLEFEDFKIIFNGVNSKKIKKIIWTASASNGTLLEPLLILLAEITYFNYRTNTKYNKDAKLKISACFELNKNNELTDFRSINRSYLNVYDEDGVIFENKKSDPLYLKIKELQQ